MRPSDDLLTLLLPDADEAQLDVARRVTSFARLFACDAQASGSPSVRVDAERACEELERHAREGVLTAVEDLLRAHLHALLPADSFGWFGATSQDHQCAWSMLDEHRSETRAPAHVPLPGEAAGSVAFRLIECAERFGLEPSALAFWRARVTWTTEGPAAGRRALDLLDRISLAADVRLASAVDRAAVRLDQGDVRGALDVLSKDVTRAPIGRARRMEIWCRLLLDSDRRPEPAPGLIDLQDSGPLPAPLVALREILPDHAPALAGVPAEWSAPLVPHADGGDRRAYGACVLAVIARTARGAVSVHVSVAPGLAARVENWTSERDGAWIDPSAPEHLLVLEARVVRRHGAGGRPPRGALGSHSLAVVLVPILDDMGEVAGWVHVELEHHLVPGSERLAALAAAWRARVLDAARAGWGAGGAEAHSCVHEGESPDPAAAVTWKALSGATSGATPGADGGEEARILRALVRELGVKTAHRRWWGFTALGDAPRLMVAGGSGLPGDEWGEHAR